jgi:beta-glucoside operon transcriptional antiterminator
MEIIKSINNNVAIGIDSNGSQVVVFGNGIGFGKIPYDLVDMSKVQRTFYELEPKYIEMISTLSTGSLFASADLVEQAELMLDTDLNPNLVITLADHIQFAIERTEKGINIVTPLAHDVQLLYPKEYAIGLMGIDIVFKYTNIHLDENEATNIALHFINGELESEDIHSAMKNIRTVNEITEIVEKGINMDIDKTSFAYCRFVSHIQYMIKRLESGSSQDDDNMAILSDIIIKYPNIYQIAKNVGSYLEQIYNKSCNKSEILYLALHINRMKEKLN